jgi:hypothetical protein
MAVGSSFGLVRRNIGGRGSGGTGFTVSMTGQAAILRMLRQVLPAEANRALRTALNKGATITLQRMRETVPVQTPPKHGWRSGTNLSKPRLDAPRGGRLKRSLGRKYIHYRSSGNHLVMIGPRVNEGHKGRHGHLVEAGTGPRVQRTTGRSTGIMPAFRFMERALDSTRFRVEGEIAKTFRTKLMDAVRKRRRR